MIRIISFNINGLRARPHQLEKLKEVYDPDLIAIQEIKVSDEDFPPQIPESLGCLLYTSPSPRDRQKSRMPSSA